MGGGQKLGTATDVSLRKSVPAGKNRAPVTTANTELYGLDATQDKQESLPQQEHHVAGCFCNRLRGITF